MSRPRIGSTDSGTPMYTSVKNRLNAYLNKYSNLLDFLNYKSLKSVKCSLMHGIFYECFKKEQTIDQS